MAEVANLARLLIYPNPSNGQISITTGEDAIELIELYNSLGIKTDVISVKGNYASYFYNTHNMSGLYFIKVKTKENVYTRKIVFR